MKNNIMYAECQDDCFRVEGTNKKEISDVMKMHVKKMHNANITEKDARKMVKAC